MFCQYPTPYGVNLASIFFRSEFAHLTCPLQLQKLKVIFGVPAGVVNIVLMPFLLQDDVLFQQDNSHPYKAAAMQVLFLMYNWSARSSDLLPTEQLMST